MFLPYSNASGVATPWEYLPSAAGNYKVGQLLNVIGGKLVIISAASKTTPKYLCMADMTAAENDLVPVIRVDNDTIYETTLSTVTDTAAPGVMLEVSADGMEADGTAAGTFECVYVEGTTQGSVIRGRFV